MCGICGELIFDPSAAVVPAHVGAMRDQLRHRGPDAEGLFVSADGVAALGFRRLRIIDLSADADQPLPNETGSVQLVFNGEIYNFADLRVRLTAAGHRFRSRSDSEVIVHLYEEKGEAFVDDLDGMFAIGLWDARTQRLVLARDRAGKKPLFVYRDRRRLVFASEIKAFFAHPDVPIEIDESSLPSYFIHGYVPAPETLYRSVASIAPGTTVVVDRDGRTRTTKYWQLVYPDADRQRRDAGSRRDAIARVRELTTNAVRRRLVTDVPLGAFLSGGIDSTVIVGVMSQLMAEPVKTFSIGFEGHADYDETRFARIAANRFGTDHTEFRVSPSAIGLLDTLLWHFDGPFGDSSAIPTYIVSQLTRQHVTVVLTGDGGDELFAGYLRFGAAVAAERLPAGVGTMLRAVLGALPRSPHSRHWIARARRFADYMALPLLERITRWNSLFFEDLDALFTPGFVAAHAPLDRMRYLRPRLEALRRLSPLAQVMLANFETYLPYDLLPKTDRTTMAVALEARSPLLDRQLIEFAAALPDTWKLTRTGRSKAIFRDAFADIIPPEIDARPKMGFGLPLDAWFRRELREYLHEWLLAPDARCRQYLEAAEVASIVRRHVSGDANLGQQLWCLLAFERWLRLLPDWRTRARQSSAAVPVPR